jgi:pimeloyl-ACP methyl ester carboxylesterase
VSASTDAGAGLVIDVSAALPFGNERNVLAADVHVPDGRPRAVLICWPGGSYGRAYWDMHVPGHAGYSFAEHMSARGFLVIAADHLGVGGSSRPGDVDRVTLETMAAANAAFVGEVRRRLEAGGLDEGLPALPDVPVAGVGHSLGGCICVVTQALHGSYDAVANLGFTHGSKDVLEGGPTGASSDPGAPRRAAEEQDKAFFAGGWDSGYALAPRGPHHAWLYAPDVPAEVIAADDLTATAWPRQSYVEALMAGFTAPYAAQVRSPILIAFGDQDIPERPRDDAGFYTASPDITVLTIAGSAHCHNFAGNRTALWDRLGTWAAGARELVKT